MIKIALITFALGYIINYFGLISLKKLNFGQNIREDGPASHQKKSGTPTMGGIFIILTVVLSILTTAREFDPQLIVATLSCVGFGVVGFLDDLLKKIRGKNLGLRSWQKMLGILIISLMIIGYMIGSQTFSQLHPVLMLLKLNNPYLYLIFSFLVLSGTSNAVNLTDGLDGLASGAGIIAFLAFALLNFQHGNESLTYFCITMAFSLLAFLWFNHHPAQVFMGDVGSLSIGGALGTVALLSHTELNLLLIGLLFVVEALSVMIQVTSFKLTGKRVFKMSPIHHHFELLGWPETKVVIRFWIFALLAAMVGLLV